MRGATVLRTGRAEVQDPPCSFTAESQGVYDALNNELPQDDTKIAVETSIIEQIMTMMNGRCRWVPHKFNSSDAFTKIKDAHLQSCFGPVIIRYVPSKDRGCEPSRSRSGKRKTGRKVRNKNKYQTPDQLLMREHEPNRSEWFFHFCGFVQLAVRLFVEDTETPCNSDAQGSDSE